MPFSAALSCSAWPDWVSWARASKGGPGGPEHCALGRVWAWFPSAEVVPETLISGTPWDGVWLKSDTQVSLSLCDMARVCGTQRLEHMKTGARPVAAAARRVSPLAEKSLSMGLAAGQQGQSLRWVDPGPAWHREAWPAQLRRSTSPLAQKCVSQHWGHLSDPESWDSELLCLSPQHLKVLPIRIQGGLSRDAAGSPIGPTCFSSLAPMRPVRLRCLNYKPGIVTPPTE